MASLSPDKPAREDPPWLALLYTAGFCVAIGVLPWLLGMGNPPLRTVAVSLCIGLSIHSTFLVLGDALEARAPGYVSAPVLTALGLAIGLTIAGTLVLGSPLFFFREDYGSLIIGAFFGVVGFTIMSTRSRLQQAHLALQEVQAEREEQEKLRLQIELKLLQAQMEPHFLFNTLSNVVSLIDSDPTAARRTLENLTILLRRSLQRTREERTTLGDEFELVRAYLEIQSIRMHKRMSYTLDSNLDELAEVELPPMLLQPLVENAVLHGIDPLPSGGTINVQASCEDDRLVLSVDDTGAGMSQTSDRGSGGTGLRSIRERLRQLYGARAQLMLQENTGGGVTAKLSLPLDRRKSAA